jgi:hypothetical protein
MSNVVQHLFTLHIWKTSSSRQPNIKYLSHKRKQANEQPPWANFGSLSVIMPSSCSDLLHSLLRSSSKHHRSWEKEDMPSYRFYPKKAFFNISSPQNDAWRGLDAILHDQSRNFRQMKSYRLLAENTNLRGSAQPTYRHRQIIFTMVCHNENQVVGPQQQRQQDTLLNAFLQGALNAATSCRRALPWEMEKIGATRDAQV